MDPLPQSSTIIVTVGSMADVHMEDSLQSFKRRWVLNKGADRSMMAYGAVMTLFFSMLSGVWAVRSHREEVMMQTMPAVSATVLSVKELRSGVIAWIAFTRVVDDAPADCKTEVQLGQNTRAGSTIEVIPRLDSCGEPMVVGERDTMAWVVISGLCLLASIVQGFLAAQSMLRPRSASTVD